MVTTTTETKLHDFDNKSVIAYTRKGDKNFKIILAQFSKVDNDEYTLSCVHCGELIGKGNKDFLLKVINISYDNIKYFSSDCVDN